MGAVMVNEEGETPQPDELTPEESRRLSLIFGLRQRYGVPVTPEASLALAIEAAFVLEGDVALAGAGYSGVQLDTETLGVGDTIDLESMEAWPVGMVARFAKDDIYVVSMPDGTWPMMLKDDDGEWEVSSLPGWSLKDLTQVSKTWGGLVYAGWYSDYGLDGAQFEGR